MLTRSTAKKAAFILSTLIFAFIATIAFTSVPRSQTEAYAQGSQVVESWMTDFKDVGENTIVIGGYRDDASHSFALQDLKKSLEAVEVRGLIPFVEPSNLDGAQVKLRPGKGYVILDAYGNEVVSGQAQHS